MLRSIMVLILKRGQNVHISVMYACYSPVKVSSPPDIPAHLRLPELLAAGAAALLWQLPASGPPGRMMTNNAKKDFETS